MPEVHWSQEAGISMIVRKPEPPLQEADIIFRPKRSGIGQHYGTVVRTESVVPPNALHGIYPKFVVAHTMPGTGKSATTIEEFLDGKVGRTIRPQRNTLERRIVEARAISDFGRPFAALDNCETDVNRVHTGVATSPTAKLIGGALFFGLLVAICKD
jgi:hypothetical protein